MKDFKQYLIEENEKQHSVNQAYITFKGYNEDAGTWATNDGIYDGSIEVLFNAFDKYKSDLLSEINILMSEDTFDKKRAEILEIKKEEINELFTHED